LQNYYLESFPPDKILNLAPPPGQILGTPLEEAHYIIRNHDHHKTTAATKPKLPATSDRNFTLKKGRGTIEPLCGTDTTIFLKQTLPSSRLSPAKHKVRTRLNKFGVSLISTTVIVNSYTVSKI